VGYVPNKTGLAAHVHQEDARLRRAAHVERDAGDQLAKEGDPEGEDPKKSLRPPAGVKTGGCVASGAADEALGAVRGGVDGSRPGVDDGPELRDRLPAALVGLLHSMSRIWTKNSKPCARASSRRNRTPIAGQRRKTHAS
jgi:hypothetical protein